MIDRACCGGRHGVSCGGEIIVPAADDPTMAHEIGVQRQMTADLIVGMADQPPKPGEFGPLWPCGIDPATGKPYNLAELFDRYALALLVVDEVMRRSAQAG